MSIVSHKGIVKGVGKDAVTVLISPTAQECDGCAISKMCNKSEVVTVAYDNPNDAMIGQEVTVGITASSQRRATWLFFVVPLALMIAVAVVITTLTSLSEGWAAMIAMAIVCVWYLMMYVLRGHLKSDIRILSRQDNATFS